MKQNCFGLLRPMAFVLLVSLSSPVTVMAQLSMPQLFQSGMVLQRGKPIPIWGKAAPGQQITVTFRKKQYVTVADDNGHWRVDLPKQKAGGPYTLEVMGDGGVVMDNSNTQHLTFSDVLIGHLGKRLGEMIDIAGRFLHVFAHRDDRSLKSFVADNFLHIPQKSVDFSQNFVYPVKHGVHVSLFRAVNIIAVVKIIPVILTGHYVDKFFAHNSA